MVFRADELVGERSLDRDYDLFMTGDWDARHSTPEARELYGVWRWRGIYDNRDWLVPLLEASERILDFGGAQGPLGFDSICADILSPTIWGDQTCRLNASPTANDVVFTSHTLEHIETTSAYENVLWTLGLKLREGGMLICHVPYRTSTWWHPEKKPEHHRIFAKMPPEPVTTLDWAVTTLAIDIAEVGPSMIIERNERVADGSLLVVAKRWMGG
jgi:hypothetical protein